MYRQLKRKNLGDFKNEDYWSSTAYHSQNFGSGSISSLMGGGDRRLVRPICQVERPAN